MHTRTKKLMAQVQNHNLKTAACEHALRSGLGTQEAGLALRVQLPLMQACASLSKLALPGASLAAMDCPGQLSAKAGVTCWRIRRSSDGSGFYGQAVAQR